MTEADADQHTLFTWYIENAFVPWRERNTYLFHGSPTTQTVLEMKISQTEHSFNTWEFLLSLKFLLYSGSDNTAVKLKLGIKHEYDRLVKRRKRKHVFKERINCILGEGNDYTHTHDWRVTVKGGQTILNSHLSVMVKLFPPSPDIAPQENDSVFYVADLRKLSEDLKQLRLSPRYTDLNLSVKNPICTVPAHSYILRTRWSNFFNEHPEENVAEHPEGNIAEHPEGNIAEHPEGNIAERTVEIDYPKPLLDVFLNYAYYGLGISEALPELNTRGFPSTNDIVEVMDRYRLHGVCKFLINRNRPRRVIEQLCLHDNCEFTLNQPEFGLVSRDLTYTWIPLPTSEYGFLMDLHFVLKPNDSKVSFTLKSRSEKEWFARMTLLLKIHNTMPRTKDKYKLMYEIDFTLQPNETTDCPDSVFHQPYPQKLVEYLANIGNEQVGEPHLQLSIVCILVLCDGNIKNVTPVLNRNRSGDENKLLAVLSNDMSKLLTLGTGCDLQIECPTLNPGSSGEVHKLHKAIFECRVPKWKRVVEDPPVEDAIPDNVRCRFSSEAFRHILNYIYTGKLGRLNTELLEEVYDFANLGEFEALKALIGKIRDAP